MDKIKRKPTMKPSIEKLKSIQDEMIFTLEEAAAVCGVTSAGVRLWGTKGVIRLIRVGSRLYVTGVELKKAFDL